MSSILRKILDKLPGLKDNIISIGQTDHVETGQRVNRHVQKQKMNYQLHQSTGKVITRIDLWKVTVKNYTRTGLILQ